MSNRTNNTALANTANTAPKAARKPRTVANAAAIVESLTSDTATTVATLAPTVATLLLVGGTYAAPDATATGSGSQGASVAKPVWPMGIDVLARNPLYVRGTCPAYHPAVGTVPRAVLDAVGGIGGAGCTVDMAQAAIDRIGRKGAHNVYKNARWLAGHGPGTQGRGYEWSFVGGLLTCTAGPA